MHGWQFTWKPRKICKYLEFDKLGKIILENLIFGKLKKKLKNYSILKISLKNLDKTIFTGY